MNIPNEVGDWKKISELGSGAFGTVMLWRNNKTDESVAIKKCKFHTSSALSPKQKERWHKEVDFMKLVSHPNVIKYKELDPVLNALINKYNPSKMPILPMEYCTKGNLRKHLTSEPLNLCGLREEDLKSILTDITSGLKYLHNKNITHRDLKPENIVLQDCGNRKGHTIYIIIDLGYAKELQDATLSFVGTLHYLAPEIFYGGKYDKSVDYWSLGMIAFELCCGVLPFLPELTPFERFEKIKTKEFNHICIYTSYSGAVSTSSNIKRENFLTSCLKQNMETWFKQVFQLDASKRMLIDNIDSFDYLESILKQQIIQVYCVYNLNFYSYELGDMTLDTFKSCISEDIEVAVEDLLLLFCNTTCDNEPNIMYSTDNVALVKTLLKDKECTVYAYKKNAPLIKSPSDIPNLLKELFKGSSNIRLEFAKPLYRQALYFVHRENQMISELKQAFLALIKHIQNAQSTLDIKEKKGTELFNNLLKRIHNANRSNTMENIQRTEQLESYLKYYERLLSNLERRSENLRRFYKQMQILNKRIDECREIIMDIFQKHDLSQSLQKLNSKTILEKGPDGTINVIFDRIRMIVNDILKTEYKLFNKCSDMRNCVKTIWCLLDITEKLGSWLNEFIDNVQELGTDLDGVQKWYEELVANNRQFKRESELYSLGFNQEHSLQIIKENRQLRDQLNNKLVSVVTKKIEVDDLQLE